MYGQWSEDIITKRTRRTLNFIDYPIIDFISNSQMFYSLNNNVFKIIVVFICFFECVVKNILARVKIAESKRL